MHIEFHISHGVLLRDKSILLLQELLTFFVELIPGGTSGTISVLNAIRSEGALLHLLSSLLPVVCLLEVGDLLFMLPLVCHHSLGGLVGDLLDDPLIVLWPFVLLELIESSVGRPRLGSWVLHAPLVVVGSLELCRLLVLLLGAELLGLVHWWLLILVVILLAPFIYWFDSDVLILVICGLRLWSHVL